MEIKENTGKTLYTIITEIAGIWTIFNIGYYMVLPLFGIAISYNSSPEILTLYYIVCAIITFLFFKDTYNIKQSFDSKIVFYGILSLSLSIILWTSVYIFSLFPVIHGPKISAYTDIILATPWYFLPKSIEILIQQLMISVLVLELYKTFQSLKSVIIGYLICFGGAHLVLFYLNGSPVQYSLIMTISAFASTLFFPYLILKVRGGFLYSYAIHFIFYVLLAVLFHAFPPPGYII
jgi:hypothetical protein